MIAEKLDHIAGTLAILTPETLACPVFQSSLRLRLRVVADEVRQLELLALAAAGVITLPVEGVIQ